MEKINIVLHLNANGQKAIGKETKNLQIKANPNTDIITEVIDSVFPMSLVDYFEIKESFANLQKGDYVKVIDLNGNGHLGCVNYINDKYIKVTLEDYELLRENWTNFSNDFHPYLDYFIEFNMFGIEKTRCKQKLRITNITDAEIKYCKDYIEKTSRNKPLVDILKILTEASNLDIDFNDLKYLKLTIPEWMTPAVLHNVYSILNNAKNNYDEYENDDD